MDRRSWQIAKEDETVLCFYCRGESAASAVLRPVALPETHMDLREVTKRGL
jgi:hypothetical protein